VDKSKIIHHHKGQYPTSQNAANILADMNLPRLLFQQNGNTVNHKIVAALPFAKPEIRLFPSAVSFNGRV